MQTFPAVAVATTATAVLLALALPAAALAQDPPQTSGCTELTWTFPAEREAEVKNFVVKNGIYTRGTLANTARSIPCATLQLAAGLNSVTVQAMGVVSGNNSPALDAPVVYVPPPLPAPANPIYQ